MVFSLILFAEKPCGRETRMFLESDGTHKTTICPIKGIKGKSELTLSMATCFAPTTPNSGIQESPFTSAAAEAHLKVYLKKMGANNGETCHGFWSAWAIP